MNDVTHTLRTAFKIIDALLKGPYTAKEIADIVGSELATCYLYIRVIGDFLPVSEMKRKINATGRIPKVYWIER